MKESVENVVVTSERDEQTEKMVTFLRKIKAEQVLGDETSKREFIENLTFEEFKGWLERLNGIVRDIPIAKRNLDGNGVALVPRPGLEHTIIGMDLKTSYPPRQQDKEDLFRETLSLAQGMAHDGSSLEDIAILLSTSINAVHGFMDGNGRTSRLVNFLVTTDYSGGLEQVEYLGKLLGEKGRLFINLNPSKARLAIEDHISSIDLGIDSDDPSLPKSLSSFTPPGIDLEQEIGEKVPAEIRDDFEKHILGHGGDYGFFAVYSFLKKNGRLGDLTSPIIDEDVLVWTDLRVANLLQALRSEDYKEILDTYWVLKKRGVSVLMNAIAKPEDYLVSGKRYRDLPKGQTIKDHFLDEVDKSYESSFLEVNHKSISEIWSERNNLHFSEDTFSLEEMQALHEIKLKLNEITEKEKLEREALHFDFETAEKSLSVECAEISKQNQSPFKGDGSAISKEGIRLTYEAKKKMYKPILDVSSKYLDEAVTLLDGLDIWKSKFTTRDASRWAADEEREDTDSFYYVTKSNQSLRLRRYALIEEGMAGVIQPFMEKIFYLEENDHVVDDPMEGGTVTEYVTDEFTSAQDNDVPREFHSQIRRYEKDGETIYLNPVDGHMHRGYQINKFR